MIDEIISIFLNALPIGILFIPLFFIWKKAIGKLYMRIVVGIAVFYLIYWVLPIIFQFRIEPKELEGGNATLGVGFMVTHFISLIIQFFTYPLVTLPFIFFVAPFVSFIFVWNKLRKEEGSKKENLAQITYVYKESPFERIKSEIIRNDWSREKEILKLMIILLPISLYLLQVILDITNLESFSLSTGETALGWFLEILFIYLAILLFSIELVFSSQIALKGRNFGEKIRQQAYSSFTTVGIPISILSLVLFVINYLDSIDVIIYFFAYFIMGSIIFVLFLDIFEPISILIFIKLIDWWKNRKIKKIDYSNSYFNLIFGVIALLIVLSIIFLFGPLMVTSFFGEPGSPEYTSLLESARFISDNPSLVNAIKFDLLIIYGIIQNLIAPLIIFILFLNYGLKYVKNVGLGYVLFLPMIIIFSIIEYGAPTFWVTGQMSYITVDNFNFYTLRTTSFEADLSGLLYVLAIPYLFTQFIFNIITWSFIIHYIRKDFVIKNLPVDDKFVERTAFSKMSEFININDFRKGTTQYLITKNEQIVVERPEQERAEVKNLLNALDEFSFSSELKPENEKDLEKFYFTLKYLFFTKQISIWKTEFSFAFQKVQKQALYVIYGDGRGVVDYPFVKEGLQDPGIISGMFSAITSFIKETTKSTEVLKTIDHGDVTILIEYGKHVFGALFIVGGQASEERSYLKEFVKTFEEKHSDVLIDWTGALEPFRGVNKLVEGIFKEE